MIIIIIIIFYVITCTRGSYKNHLIIKGLRITQSTTQTACLMILKVCKFILNKNLEKMANIHDFKLSNYHVQNVIHTCTMYVL